MIYTVIVLNILCYTSRNPNE